MKLSDMDKVLLEKVKEGMFAVICTGTKGNEELKYLPPDAVAVKCNHCGKVVNLNQEAKNGE